MAITPFLDDLALVEVLLFLTATILAYASVLAYWAVRNDRSDDLRRVLRGSAVPVGGLGAAALLLALWGEMSWPFLASDGLAGYNIFFFDPLMLLGLVLVAYAVAVTRGVPLQFVGLLALASGAVVAFYGWTGYTASPAFTEDPVYTFLLYGAFGLAGLFALPATVAVDHYLRAKDRNEAPWVLSNVVAVRLGRMGSRAAMPIVPDPNLIERAGAPVHSFRPPAWIQLVLVLLPVALVLASIASLWYFGTTLPGHLGAGPGAAP
jgi:uncharacterized membrane protein